MNELEKNIFKAQLNLKIQAKIQQINEQIEIAEEEHNEELIERLIKHRRKVRNLLDEDGELLVDHSKYSVI